MSVAVLVLTDGRDEHLHRTMDSWAEVLDHPAVTERWMHDDSGDRDHRARLAEQYSTFRQIGVGPRRGFTGTMDHVWWHLRRYGATRYVLHLEDDFLLNRPLDLDSILDVLEGRPHLAQVALRRQSWSAAEHLAGGVVEVEPDAWRQWTVGRHEWLERRGWWTCNPSVYPISTTAYGWPRGKLSEITFARVMAAAGLSSAFWGPRSSPPWVEHIGTERVGHGY